MLVKCISDAYIVEPKKGGIYEAEREVRGMYYIRDNEGELFAYPAFCFERVDSRCQAEKPLTSESTYADC